MFTLIKKTCQGVPNAARAAGALFAFGVLLSLSACGSDSVTPSPVAKTPSQASAAVAQSVDSASASGGARTVASSKDSLSDSPVSPTANALNVKSVFMEPAQPIAGETIRVNLVFNEDSPPVTTLFYRWKINDQVVQESSSAELQKPTAKGDRIEVLVFLGGMNEESKSVRGYATIGNAPPSIRKAEERLDEKGQYFARFEPVDKDGDAISLALQRGPEGMTLDSGKQQVHWSVPKDAKGSFPVEVLASDSSGSQVLFAYTISIRQE